MARLMQTVKTETAKRSEEQTKKLSEIQKQKADDWNKFKAEYPEGADFATQMTAAFGKPKLFLVWNDDGIILDSRKYDPLHPSNKHRK